CVPSGNLIASASRNRRRSGSLNWRGNKELLPASDPRGSDLVRFLTMDKASVQRILERHEQRGSNQRGLRAVFTRENLQGFDFAGRDLIGMQFIACDLRGARFQGCNLSFSQFTCCDLRTADLRNVQAASVSFHGSDLREADMRKVFTGIDSSFSAADLRGARI